MIQGKSTADLLGINTFILPGIRGCMTVLAQHLFRTAPNDSKLRFLAYTRFQSKKMLNPVLAAEKYPVDMLQDKRIELIDDRIDADQRFAFESNVMRLHSPIEI